MEIRITRYHSVLPEQFRTIPVSAEMDLSFVSGELHPDRSSPFFPERSDEKVMREDVKAAVLAVQQMMEGYSAKLLSDSDLYVANGVFIEDTGKQLQRVIDVYRQLNPDISETEKVRRLYQATPPLLALQTLTNSTMSFISQYAGIRGNNATFGNTSLSAFHALQKAAMALNSGTERAMVCASNCGGAVSFLTFQSFFDDQKEWKESAAVSCLFLENDLQAKPVCRITEMKSVSSPVQNEQRNWHSMPSGQPADFTLFSGAFTEKQYRDDFDYCSSFAQNPFSFFPDYGNCGSASILLSVNKAIGIIRENPESVIDIFDRDPYGRESYIRVQA